MTVEAADQIDTDQQVGILPSPQHTMPTQEELAAQARLSEPMIGVHKRGLASCEVREVEDGFAYRLYGSSEETPWQWQRVSDFLKDYDLLTLFNPAPGLMVAGLMTAEIERWRARSSILYRVMGKKSRKRFRQMLEAQKQAQIEATGD